MKTLILLFLAIACSSAPKPKDLTKAWVGQSAITLEKHKFYSTLPVEEKLLSDNEIRYNFVEKKTKATGSRTCFGTGFGGSRFGRGGFGTGVGIGASSCSPQEFKQDNCTHQFIVKAETITEYNLLGDDCLTDCKMLPKSKCK